MQKSKRYNRPSEKHLFQTFTHENYVLNITTVKLHHVIDILNQNALEKWRALTAQSLSVLLC